MFAKRVKRKCSVRACRNTDCFAISRSREMGNSIIICKSCLTDALEAIADDSGAKQPANDVGFKCDNCGKVFDSDKGLKTHLRYCKTPQQDKGADAE